MTSKGTAMTRACAAVAAASLAFSLARGAGAESALQQCSSYDLVQVAPRSDGLTIPANAPALAVDYSPQWKVDFELVGPDGVALAFTLETDPYPYSNGGRLLRLDAPLKEGKGYELRWTQTCLNQYPTPKKLEGVRVFDVGPAVAWPSPSGTVEAQVDGAGKVSSLVKLSPEAIAFLPLASIRLDTTKNASLALHDYGEFTTAVLTGTWSLSCPTTGLVHDAFTLNVHVAGTAADPMSVPGPFEYDCPKVSAPDAGPSKPDGGAAPPFDAGIPEDGPDGIWDSAPAASTSDGCSTRAHGRDSGVGVGLIALALFAVGHLLRRRL